MEFSTLKKTTVFYGLITIEFSMLLLEEPSVVNNSANVL